MWATAEERPRCERARLARLFRRESNDPARSDQPALRVAHSSTAMLADVANINIPSRQRLNSKCNLFAEPPGADPRGEQLQGLHHGEQFVVSVVLVLPVRVATDEAATWAATAEVQPTHVI